MKKLMKKKNNKGFSLVELIVVVLILGIIAVALAPQVMKWVGKARTNSDENTAKDIKSSVQIALADWQQAHNVPSATATFTIKKGTDIAFEEGTNWAGLVNCLKEVIGDDNNQYPQTSGGGAYTVTLTGNGTNISVAVTYS